MPKTAWSNFDHIESYIWYYGQEGDPKGVEEQALIEGGREMERIFTRAILILTPHLSSRPDLNKFVQVRQFLHDNGMYEPEAVAGFIKKAGSYILLRAVLLELCSNRVDLNVQTDFGETWLAKQLDKPLEQLVEEVIFRERFFDLAKMRFHPQAYGLLMMLLREGGVDPEAVPEDIRAEIWGTDMEGEVSK